LVGFVGLSGPSHAPPAQPHTPLRRRRWLPSAFGQQQIYRHALNGGKSVTPSRSFLALGRRGPGRRWFQAIKDVRVLYLLQVRNARRRIGLPDTAGLASRPAACLDVAVQAAERVTPGAREPRPFSSGVCAVSAAIAAKVERVVVVVYGEPVLRGPRRAASLPCSFRRPDTSATPSAQTPCWVRPAPSKPPPPWRGAPAAAHVQALSSTCRICCGEPVPVRPSVRWHGVKDTRGPWPRPGRPARRFGARAQAVTTQSTSRTQRADHAAAIGGSHAPPRHALQSPSTTSATASGGGALARTPGWVV